MWSRRVSEPRLKAFMMQHDDPVDFLTSQWTEKTLPYVIYRSIVAAYFLSWFVISLSTFTGVKYKYFIYATNWAFILLEIDALLQTILIIKYLRPSRNIENVTLFTLSTDIKVSWFIHNAAANLSICVTVGYWAQVYGGQSIASLTVHTHGVNAVYYILDAFLSARPYRFFQVYQPLFFSMLFVLFTVIYWVAGGRDQNGKEYLYPGLNWRKPQVAVRTVLIFAVGIVVIVQILYCFIYFIRRNLFKEIWKLKNAKQRRIARMEEVMESTDSCSVVHISGDLTV